MTGKKPAFACPQCRASVPRWKSVTFTRSTQLRCKKCGAAFRPDLRTLQLTGKIGALGGMLAVFIYMIKGVAAAAVVFAIFILAAWVMAIKMATFEIVDE